MPTINRRYYRKPEGQKNNRAFYNSHRWHTLSTQWRAKQPLCQECLRKGRTTAGQCVDHIRPIENGGEQWDITNLQTLCFRCHNSKTQMEQQKATVILVYGPPCSGKSTYIRENIKEGDVLLDIDEISEEIYNTRQRTTTQLDHVLQEREARLKTHLRDHVTIWIPTTYIDKGVFTRVKHRVITILKTQNECLSYLEDSNRINKEYQRSIIQEWFDRQG